MTFATIPTPTDLPEWPAPPRPLNAEGVPRRIGIELEFAGLTAAETADLVQRHLGGALRTDSAHRIAVEGSDIGDVLVELDFKYAHEGDPDDAFRRALASLGATVLPMEVIFPPARFEDAPRIDALREELRRAGAEGTFASPVYAFGAQLNPEVPELSPEYVLASLRSFILLREWLREQIDIDPSRKLWFFAAPFPRNYCHLILAEDYAPDMTRLIDDYLAYNPTRNREVDMLPLFAHIDEARVRKALPHETIKARPTWHYRLPNAEIDDADWSLGAEWKRWRKVELLIERSDLLAQWSRAWLEEDDRIFGDGWLASSRRLADAL